MTCSFENEVYSLIIIVKFNFMTSHISYIKYGNLCYNASTDLKYPWENAIIIEMNSYEC
jgi:hypothetical protein